MIVLLEREEDAYLNDLLDQYPALRNAEMCWCLPVKRAQMDSNIGRICKLIDCTEVTIPSYAADALSSVPPPFCRSPLRLLQFIKTFAGLYTERAQSISCRCDVLKVSFMEYPSNLLIQLINRLLISLFLLPPAPLHTCSAA